MEVTAGRPGSRAEPRGTFGSGGVNRISDVKPRACTSLTWIFVIEIFQMFYRDLFARLGIKIILYPLYYCDLDNQEFNRWQLL